MYSISISRVIYYNEKKISNLKVLWHYESIIYDSNLFYLFIILIL